MNLRVASDRLGYCPDRPLLHLSYAFEPPAVHAIGVDLAPLGAAGHPRPHPAPRLHPLAPELGRVHAGYRSSLLRHRKPPRHATKQCQSPAPTSLSPERAPIKRIIQAKETYVLTAYTSKSAFQHAQASPSLVSTAAAPPCQHAASLQSAAFSKSARACEC